MKKVNNKATPSANQPANKRRGKRRRLWSRTKSSKKKPKFLSLRENFPAAIANDQGNIIVDNKLEHQLIKRRCTGMSSTIALQSSDDEIKDQCHHDQENVAMFFSGGEGGATTTLTGLLDAAGATVSDLSLVNNSSSSCRLDRDLSISSASLTYGYGGSKDPSVSAAALVRNALRSKERDSSEEKWVCYSEVVDRKEQASAAAAVVGVVKEEEVTSLSAVDRSTGIRRLSLKLDYEEILNAWSDKGRPLYIDAASDTSSLQIVPEFNDQLDHELLFNSEASTNNNCMCGEGGSNMNLWTVPQMTTVEMDQNVTTAITTHEMKKMMKKEVIDEEELRVGHREVSLLRYKEKRLNRLFSKTIRYEVRKLNAEKRPRLKGRFVKRS